MDMSSTIQAELGCCEQTSLQTIRTLRTALHGTCALRRCASCGQYWIYRCDELDDFSAPTAVVIWYMPVEPSEAPKLEEAALQEAELTLPRRETHHFLYYEGEDTCKHTMAESIPERPW